MKCEHARTEYGPDRPFFYLVAQEPYTHENRSAHGGISYLETCLDCKSERTWNQNGLHTERSPWNTLIGQQKRAASRRARSARFMRSAREDAFEAAWEEKEAEDRSLWIERQIRAAR